MDMESNMLQTKTLSSAPAGLHVPAFHVRPPQAEALVGVFSFAHHGIPWLFLHLLRFAPLSQTA